MHPMKNSDVRLNQPQAKFQVPGWRSQNARKKPNTFQGNTIGTEVEEMVHLKIKSVGFQEVPPFFVEKSSLLQRWAILNFWGV